MAKIHVDNSDCMKSFEEVASVVSNACSQLKLLTVKVPTDMDLVIFHANIIVIKFYGLIQSPEEITGKLKIQMLHVTLV